MDKAIFKVTDLNTGKITYKEIYLCEFVDPRATPIWLANLYRQSNKKGLAKSKTTIIEKVQ